MCLIDVPYDFESTHFGVYLFPLVANCILTMVTEFLAKCPTLLPMYCKWGNQASGIYTVFCCMKIRKLLGETWGMRVHGFVPSPWCSWPLLLVIVCPVSCDYGLRTVMAYAEGLRAQVLESGSLRLNFFQTTYEFGIWVNSISLTQSSLALAQQPSVSNLLCCWW